jgi:hypothetical protein
VVAAASGHLTVAAQDDGRRDRHDGSSNSGRDGCSGRTVIQGKSEGDVNGTWRPDVTGLPPAPPRKRTERAHGGTRQVAGVP